MKVVQITDKNTLVGTLQSTLVTVIRDYVEDTDISVATVVGVLECVKHDLLMNIEER